MRFAIPQAVFMFKFPRAYSQHLMRITPVVLDLVGNIHAAVSYRFHFTFHFAFITDNLIPLAKQDP